MASNYPGSLDSFDTIASDKKTSDAVGGRTHRQMHNDLGDAVESVQTELGTNPSGSDATVAARLSAIEAGTNLATGAVTSAKIADGTVTASKLATGVANMNLLTDNVATGCDALGTTSGFYCATAYVTLTADNTVSAAVKQGSYAIKFAKTSSTNMTPWVAVGAANVNGSAPTSGTIPVIADEEYTFEVWVSSQSSTDSATPVIYWWTSAGNVAAATAYHKGAIYPMTTTPTRRYVTATAPSNAAYACVAVRRGAPGYGAAANTTATTFVAHADRWGFWRGRDGTWARPGRAITGTEPAPSGLLDTMTWPAIAAHYCDQYGAGRHTVASAEMALAAGVQIIDGDMYLSADGVPIFSHNATFDTYTDATGDIADYNVREIVHTISATPSDYLYASGYPDQPVVTADEMVRRFAGRAILLIQQYWTSTDHVQELCDRWRWAKDSLIIQADWEPGKIWAANGFAACGVGISGASEDDYADAGFKWVMLDRSTASLSSRAASIHGYGMKLAVFGGGRRHHYDTDVAAGADIVDTDFAAHVFRTETPPTMRADFSRNVFPPGIQTADGIPTISSGRLTTGSCTGTEPSVLLGSCGPTPALCALSLVGQYASGTGWMGLALQGPLDQSFKTAEGYYARLTPAGVMTLHKHTSAGSETQIGTVDTGAAVPANTNITLTLQVTATDVVATRADTATTLTVADTTYRHASWYPHAIRSTNLTASWALATVA